LCSGGPDGGLRKLRGIGPPAALFHIRKLITQCSDAAASQAGSNGVHERMRHSGPGTMPKDITGARRGRHPQQAGDGMRIIDNDADVLGVPVAHWVEMLCRSRWRAWCIDISAAGRKNAAA
jgi:hypothetical protein